MDKSDKPSNTHIDGARDKSTPDRALKPAAGTLWVLLTSATLTIMAGSVIAPVLNLMRQGLSIDPAAVGLIITTHGLFIAIFSPLMGSIIDRVGPKGPYVIGLFLYGVAGGGGLFIESYWLLIFSRALLGISLAAFYNSITVIILSLYQGGRRDKIMGWRGSANSLGGIIYPILGGFLGGFSWHWPFAIYTIGIPLAFLVILTVPETGTSKPFDIKSKSGVISIFKTTPILFAIYGTMFSANLLLYSIVIFLPQLLEKMGITQPLHISFFMSFMIFAAGVASFNYRRIRSKLSYRHILLAAAAFWAAAFILLTQTTSGLLIVVSLGLSGIGLGLIIPTLPVWIGEVVPPAFHGRFSSYMGTFGFIGQFISPLFFAPILIATGLGGVFLAAAGIAVLVLIIFWMLL